jgi:hypothetical protein
MSLQPLWEEIEKLAPDPATLERCYRLASKRYLKDFGVCEPFIWGKIKSSGATFYQVCWQLDTLKAASNAPVYPKPDKYTLALAFYYCKYSREFPNYEVTPPWVIPFLSKKPLSESEIREKEFENQRLREKNLLKRQAEMLQGCQVLTLWIEDSLQMGLARWREQPFSYWESIITRLNDFKLNGIASRLLPLFHRRNDENWLQISMKQLGEIILFCEAFQKWDDFNPENGGVTMKKEALLQEPALSDSWFVCSTVQRTVSEDLNARHVWLLGWNTNQFAQIISYSWRGEPWDDAFTMLTSIKGNIHFYPSGFPQRAVWFPDEESPPSPAPFPSGYKDWASFFNSYRAACNQQFLLEEFPGIVQNLRVLPGEAMFLQDQNGAKVTINPSFSEKWELVALNQDSLIKVFGTWDGLYFTPKSYSH